MADARRAQLKDQTGISGARALIVEARFYDDIQDALLEGAVAELKAAGVTHDVITVPGALEIPAAIAIALEAAENSGGVGAGADGVRSRRIQWQIRGVREPLARRRGRGRLVFAGRGRVVQGCGGRRGARPGVARSDDR